MTDNRKATASKPIATDSGKWMWRIVIAIILGEAIWGFLLSITNDLILPLIARTIGSGESVTPKASLNVPAMFASVVELCLAGAVAILLNSWFTRPAKSRAQPASAGISTSVPAPAADRNAASTTIALAPAVAAPANAPAMKVKSAPPPASPAPKPPKPEKAKPSQKVYYNIVGEPVEPDEE